MTTYRLESCCVSSFHFAVSDDDEQPMADSLRRKRRVRGGHRGTVTRLPSKLPSVLESTDVSRLKQMMGSLKEKMDLLAKMDDEIVEIVSCDKLVREIEQADLIREDISHHYRGSSKHQVITHIQAQV